MSTSESSKFRVRALLAVVVVSCVGTAAWWYFAECGARPRGEALGVALRSLIDKQNPDQSLVARAILDNYLETRSNAANWSGVYWGFTFLAAVLSALAGLILKFEAIVKNDAIKKDIAAFVSVAIVGSMEQRNPAAEPSKGTPAKQ